MKANASSVGVSRVGKQGPGNPDRCERANSIRYSRHVVTSRLKVARRGGRGRDEMNVQNCRTSHVYIYL